MTTPIPRLPVIDWNTFSGPRLSATPCLLTRPGTSFTTSGRASILLALEMLGVEPGDKILVPTYHCPTMIAPIDARGAEPIFYPLNGSGAPRLDWLQQHDTEHVRVILVAHFFGLPQPLQEIREWCDQRGIRLIEDCAHALFGAIEARAIGSWGDIAIGSLTKFLPVPEGGCLVHNTSPRPTPALCRPTALNQLRAAFDIVHSGANHGRLKGLGGAIRGFYQWIGALKKKPRIETRDPKLLASDGFAIDVALSHRALTYASSWIARHAPRERIVSRRREHYKFFSQALSDLPGFRPICPKLPDDCAPYVFPLLVSQPDPGYAELRRLELPVSRWDRLWPTVPSIEGDHGILWSHHVLQLACHQDLSTDETQQMVDTLKRLFAPRVARSGTARARSSALPDPLETVRTAVVDASTTPSETN